MRRLAEASRVPTQAAHEQADATRTGIPTELGIALILVPRGVSTLPGSNHAARPPENPRNIAKRGGMRARRGATPPRP
jgi:hypothetical protein